jgi:hypothetical protein
LNHNRARFGEAHEMEASLPNIDPDRRNFHEMPLPLLSVDHPHRQGRTIPLPYTPTNNGALTSPRNDDTGGNWLPLHDAGQYVFLDECGLIMDLLRRYGRSPRGTRLHDHAP